MGGGQTGHHHAKPKPHSNFVFNGIYIYYIYNIYNTLKSIRNSMRPSVFTARGRFEVLLLRRAVEVRLDPWRGPNADWLQIRRKTQQWQSSLRFGAPEIRRHTVQTWLELPWNGLNMFETCLAHFFLWGCSQRSFRRLFVVYPCAFVFSGTYHLWDHYVRLIVVPIPSANYDGTQLFQAVGGFCISIRKNTA